MAVTTVTAKEVFNFTTPTGFGQDGSSPAKNTLACFVTASVANATYAQANDSQITALDQTIANARRNGKTINIIQVACAEPGIYGSTPTPMGAGPTFTLSGTNNGTVVFPLTQGDLSTEFADATAIGAETKPICLFVFFTEV